MQPQFERPRLATYAPPLEGERILRVEKLRKTHIIRNGGSKKHGDLVVLDDVSFEVGEGEFLTIIGPSGCGKSTLLDILAGLEPYDSGDVIVSGHRVNSNSPDIIIIFQEDALFPWLTVRGNVEFGLKEQGVSAAERRAKADYYIQMVGLTRFAESYVHQLSGGMKKRVAIARGLAMDPRILLMDEPFGALDAKTRGNLQRQIQEIHASTGKTIIFVTHDVREAVCLGDRVMLFSHGPGKIRRQFVVDLPRPRRAEDLALHDLIGQVLNEFSGEAEFAENGDGDSDQ